MNLIVAVDSNWAIGSKNELLIRIPNDHKHFREETTGKVVVLGRKTLETFPQGMPLKNRTNIILSKDPNYQVKDAIVVHSIEELLEELKKYDEENIYRPRHFSYNFRRNRCAKGAEHREYPVVCGKIRSTALRSGTVHARVFSAT